jgi:TPR repeat protein
MKLRMFAIGIGLSVALCQAPAWAGPAGEAAFKAGDYAAAIEDFMYEANRGVAESQANLGAMYVAGLGVPQDPGTAFDWFHKAAQQGHPNAEYSVGAMYLNGLGVPRDYGKALEWLRKAAQHGQVDAQSRLAMMYERGTGVAKDYVVAYAWYNTSAANVNDLSVVTHRQILEQRMPAAQLEKAQKLSREYYEKYVVPFRGVN